jgi:hypothetical protein
MSISRRHQDGGDQSKFVFIFMWLPTTSNYWVTIISFDRTIDKQTTGKAVVISGQS